MHRLWVRLSLAFSTIIMLSVLAILATTFLFRGSDIRPSVINDLQKEGGTVDRLVEHYQADNTWDGAEAILAPRELAFTPGRRNPVTLTLADDNGWIIYATSDEILNTQLDDTQRKESIPIEIDGQLRAYLTVTITDAGINDTLQSIVLRRFQDSIILVAITGSIIGILFGTLVSRSLTAPLNSLVEGARAIRDRRFSQRVTATGSQEIAEVAQAFNEMAEALEEAENLRRNLVADVAHELRTPLSVLQAQLYAILEDVYPLDKSQITRLYDQTRVLSRLVNDLHELSQAEARQLPLSLESLDLRLIIEDIVTTFEPIAQDKGIILTTELSPDLPIMSLDAERINQVLYNLANNALRHTPAGGTVTIRANCTNDYVCLAVEDTGEGIPQAHLKHIFDRFYRIDSTRNRSTGGVGLGLAIVRAIVEAHGGKIQATSNGTSGSTFTILLPLRS